MVANTIHLQRHAYYGALTTAQINSINGVQVGDFAFNTTMGYYVTWNGTKWTLGTPYLGDFANDTAADNYISGQGWTKEIGWMYKDTTVNRMKMWNGTNWHRIVNDFTGLADTPGAHTAKAVPYTNTAGDALTVDPTFYYDEASQTLNVANVHSGDYRFLNGWKIVEADGWEESEDGAGIAIINKNGDEVLRITNDALYFKGRPIA